MLGRHQRTSPKETTLITLAWRQLHQWHTQEKRRLKRAMNKRMRRDDKLEVRQDLLLTSTSSLLNR
ncbi:hypothetical protein Ga0123461_1527 [Mariprofundus aestuarium]|uniref:Uncharacterized protein n=1 Tax=Mariprofundus aestuarium TaxID=1921086 RepID=A0A2K8L278_MARES|nr:hypothetical protein Ga0123461_1527 [Mariprofundus aestuarium]